MKEKCVNHQETNAVHSCHWCGRYLCSECLVKIEKCYYCKNEKECTEYQKNTELQLSSLEGLLDIFLSSFYMIYVIEVVIWIMLSALLSIIVLADTLGFLDSFILLFLIFYGGYFAFRFLGRMPLLSVIIIVMIWPMVVLFLGDCVRLLAYKIYRGRKRVTFAFFKDR